ncbi:glycosyltransferase family A protein [Flavobacterium sp. MK4S-17]|uniref:glycosyltransferase family 2 protein n=1 Tax=Flavobacterium sp. MK4S-17 TaxID=2543737 RepID=UPI0013567EE2|nr:glycosyltransferase family A protein [Flavobacterium sp. MK4S-17]
MPFFTVVIPLYNKEKYIGKTLVSALSQTFTDFEVLIINDSSTDKSLEAVQKFTDNRIKIIQHPVNKGLSASRNTGIKNASAEYIAFLDADDVWKPKFLQKIYGLISSYPEAGLFATEYLEVYPNGVSITHNFKLNTGVVNNFFEAGLKQPIYCPSALCVKKSILDKTGLFNENITFGEDIDFSIRANLLYKLAYYNQPMVLYTMQSENQITQSPITGKVITDFDFYEQRYPTRKDLKKYLDFNRYIIAKKYNEAGNKSGYREMIKNIDKKNLNSIQRLLLAMPGFVLRSIKVLKAKLVKSGINPTTY